MASVALGSGSRSRSKDLVQASDYGYGKPNMKISSGVLGCGSRVYGSMSSPKGGLRRSEGSQERSKPSLNSPVIGKNRQLEPMSPEAPSCERDEAGQPTSALEEMMHYVQQ